MKTSTGRAPVLVLSIALLAGASPAAGQLPERIYLKDFLLQSSVLVPAI